MHLFMILATGLCVDTVWVSAVFYVEFRDTVPSNSRPAPMDNYLYECKGIPEGTAAMQATQSQCIPVTSRDKKVKIYLNCNFYSLYRPDLQGHEIHLLGRGELLLNEWYLGFLNSAIDHPDFGEAAPACVTNFRTRVEQMGAAVVPSELVDNLARFLAQTNLIAPPITLPQFRARFLVFTTVLRKITDGYSSTYQMNAIYAAESRARLGENMKLFLKKMIDPCSFFLGFFRTAGSEHCATYCDFLNVAAVHFGTPADRCSSLQGGKCKGAVCTCNQISSHPFQGCQTSPMQLCNNAMRTKLHLLRYV